MARGGDADASWTRFWLGVWLVAIGALIYPFYSYKVVTYLMARDVEEAMKPFVAEVNASNRQVAAQQAQWSANAEAQNAANEARNMADRIRSVQIKGVSNTQGQPLAIVDYGTARSAEIVGAVCEQASVWFHRDMSGQVIRIQRYRGGQPAIDDGTVGCP
jgi:type IV secretory pathway TrbF-like protein